MAQQQSKSRQPNADAEAAAPEAGSAKGATGNGKRGESVLRVTARRERFRRAGIEFGRTETVVRVAELTDAQRAAIEDEPMLLVREDTVEAK